MLWFCVRYGDTEKRKKNRFGGRKTGYRGNAIPRRQRCNNSPVVTAFAEEMCPRFGGKGGGGAEKRNSLGFRTCGTTLCAYNISPQGSSATTTIIGQSRGIGGN